MFLDLIRPTGAHQHSPLMQILATILQKEVNSVTPNLSNSPYSSFSVLCDWSAVSQVQIFSESRLAGSQASTTSCPRGLQSAGHRRDAHGRTKCMLLFLILSLFVISLVGRAKWMSSLCVSTNGVPISVFRGGHTREPQPQDIATSAGTSRHTLDLAGFMPRSCGFARDGTLKFTSVHTTQPIFLYMSTSEKKTRPRVNTCLSNDANTLNRRHTLNSGRPGSFEPLVPLQNSEWAHLGVHLFGRSVAFGRFGGPIRNVGPARVLVWTFFSGPEKHERFKNTKIT